MSSERHDVRGATLVDPSRVRFARELRGWTQQQVVSEAGGAFTAAALSQIERGQSSPSAATLEALASAVDCPVEFFVARPGDRPPVGYFRSLRSTKARDRRQLLARARLLHNLLAALEEHVALPELDLPRYPLGDEPDETVRSQMIEHAANGVRREWSLPAGPIGNVVLELERHGLLVVRSSNLHLEVDAFSVPFDDRPVVVLGSEKAVTARSRFDAAHELGHLVIHSGNEPAGTTTEREAHAFAAAFLMPASDIREELPSRADMRVLMSLKAKWRVSIGALLRRSLDLGIMSKPVYVNAMKAMSARGWRTREPGDDLLGALEAPVLLARAVEGLAKAGAAIDDVIEAAHLPAGEVHRLLQVTRDPRPRVDLR